MPVTAGGTGEGVTRTIGSPACADSTAMASLSGRVRCLQVFQGVTEPGEPEQNHPAIINSSMKLAEITQPKRESASADLCKSSKSDEELGASNLASCKSQGLRGRKSKVRHTIKGKRQSIDGERIKGKKYGGPLPDWS